MRAVRIVAAVCCVLAIAVVAILLALPHWAGLGRYVTAKASASLHREVAADRLSIGIGREVSVAVDNLRLANAAWGSEPDMIRIGRLRGQIDILPLLRGVVRYRHLEIDHAEVLLERDKQGKGNWKFDGMAPSPPDAGGFALVPANRRQVPTLLDAVVRDSMFRMRTSSGAMIRIKGDGVTIAAAGDDAPMALAMTGSYNGVPFDLKGATQSFDALRRADVPWGARLDATFGGNAMRFDGTLMRPLDFDGVQGRVDIDLPHGDRLAPVFNTRPNGNLPLKLAATLAKQGDRWVFGDAKGAAAGDRFTGRIQLDEGARGQPDAIKFDLAFPRLDLKKMMTAMNGAQPSARSPAPESSWRPDPKPGMIVDGVCRAASIAYGRIEGRNALLDFAVKPGEVVLRALKAELAGGTVAAHGSLTARGTGARLAGAVRVDRVDAGRAARLFGDDTPPLDGRFSLHAKAAMQGRNFNAAARTMNGGMRLSSDRGMIERHLVDLASLSARALFHADREAVPYCCLYARLDIRDGVGRLQTLRLATEPAEILGEGVVDFTARRFDIDLGHRENGGVTLPLAIHVGGTFAQPSIGLERAAKTE